MIHVETILNVADNSGAKKVMCINVQGNFARAYGSIGDIITVSVKVAVPHTPIKKGSIHKAVIVRTKKEIKRKNGSYVRFGENAAVLVDDKLEPKGTRIFGPVARELREHHFTKILSLAPEVV